MTAIPIRQLPAGRRWSAAECKLSGRLVSLSAGSACVVLDGKSAVREFTAHDPAGEEKTVRVPGTSSRVTISLETMVYPEAETE